MANPAQWFFWSLTARCTLFFMLSQDCRLAKIWLSMAWTHSSLSSYVEASKFHVWPVNDTMMNSKESSCSGKTQINSELALKQHARRLWNLTLQVGGTARRLRPIHARMHDGMSFWWTQQHSSDSLARPVSPPPLLFCLMTAHNLRLIHARTHFNSFLLLSNDFKDHCH